jgi:HK97 family phage prohead protease
MRLSRQLLELPMKLETKSASFGISSFDPETRSFDVIASSETIDSYGDIVKQDWRLDRFLANPVVLFGHKSGELPIGKASNVEVSDGQLRMRITLSKTSERAQEVYGLMSEDMVKAVSVGFRPGKRTFEKRDNGTEVRVLSDNELLEVSVVAIGANPDAQAKEAGRHDADQRRNPMEEVKKALGLAVDVSDEKANETFGEVAKSILEVAGVETLGAVAGSIAMLKEQRDSFEQRSNALAAAETELKTIKAAQELAKLEQVVTDAVKAGKVPPARRDGLIERAKSFGLAWIEALVVDLPVLVDSSTSDEVKALAGKPGDPGSTPIDGELEALCKSLGLTADDIRAAQKAGHL